jgi:hypothetical protein
LLAAYLGVGPHMGSGPGTVCALLKG